MVNISPIARGRLERRARALLGALLRGAQKRFFLSAFWVFAGTLPLSFSDSGGATVFDSLELPNLHLVVGSVRLQGMKFSRLETENNDGGALWRVSALEELNRREVMADG